MPTEYTYYADWHGNLVKVARPKADHFIWKGKNFDPDSDEVVLANELWRTQPKTYYAVIQTIWPNQPQKQMFYGITPAEAELLLSLYFGYNITLTGIISGINADNGYPYWKFTYKKSEQPNQAKITMRSIVHNYNRKDGRIDIPPLWQFKTYKTAEKYTLELADATIKSLISTQGNHFRLTTDDDIINDIQNHTAAIFYDIDPNPIATFDIYGLAEFINKHGKTNWHYRGFKLYTNKKNNRIGISRNGEPTRWRRDIDRALLYIDTLLLTERSCEHA